MKPELRQRLNRLEGSMGSQSLEIIYVTESETESAEDLKARWKAGEDVDGIKGPPYEPDFNRYAFVVFKASKPNENGVGLTLQHRSSNSGQRCR